MNGTVDGDVQDPLARAILRQLGLSEQSTGTQDTLSALLSPASPESSKTQSKIAGLARIVLEQEQSSPIAAGIVAHAISTLAGFAKDIVFNAQPGPAETVMVLTGGLMQHVGFRDRLKEQILDSGVKFEGTEVILQVAELGANRLLEDLCWS